MSANKNMCTKIWLTANIHRKRYYKNGLWVNSQTAFRWATHCRFKPMKGAFGFLAIWHICNTVFSRGKPKSLSNQNG